MEVIKSPSILSLNPSSTLFSKEISLGSLEINQIQQPSSSLLTKSANYIPPYPKSSSSKFPLELSVKHQQCNMKIELDKSIYNNGDKLIGKVILKFLDKQILKRIKVQICGYEKIFQSACDSNSHNTYQTLKFYNDSINVFPPPDSSLSNWDNYIFMNNSHVELSSGHYEYPFTVQLPDYLSPSFNYIGYLSIFYMVHCEVEYSPSKEWANQKITQSTDLSISGLSFKFRDSLYQENIQHLVHSKISKFLWKNKSKPIEMAVCLKDYNCFIGKPTTFFFKIKNPMLLKLDHIKIELFQIINFIKSTKNKSPNNNDKSNNNNNNSSLLFDNLKIIKGNVSKYKKTVSESLIVSEKFLDPNSFIPKSTDIYEIMSSQVQIIIPQFFKDDQVFPSTKGYLSQIKHYFVITIPSVDSQFSLKINFKLWDNNFIKNNVLLNSNIIDVHNSSSSNNNGSSGLGESSSSNQINQLGNSSGSNESSGNRGEWSINWLPKWKDDTSVSNCELCDDPFSIINRMHHCRSCGGIFCENCSKAKVSLKAFGINKQVRICLMCNESMKLTSHPYLSSSNYGNLVKISSQSPFLVQEK